MSSKRNYNSLIIINKSFIILLIKYLIFIGFFLHLNFLAGNLFRIFILDQFQIIKDKF